MKLTHISSSSARRAVKPALRHDRRAVTPSPSEMAAEPAVVTPEQPVVHGEASGVGALQLYLREIGPLPMLSREEEASLARRVQAGDEAARDQMIKGNLRLVVKIARDYENFGLPLLDLISEGNIGLMRAVERYDPDRGAKLSVYASFWIKQSIRRAISDQSRTIRVPVHVHDKLYNINRAANRLHEILGHEPTDEEISAEVDLPAKKVARLRQAVKPMIPLDQPMNDDGSNCISETVADERCGRPDQDLVDQTNADAVREFLGKLSPRELTILRSRFGFDGDEDETLRDIGTQLGLTRERIRQIQNKALGKLKSLLLARERCGVSA
jgi:RNA polymerase primary sigma factor